MASTVTIQFTGGTTTYGGYYVGIYNGTAAGTPTDFICDDFLTEINGGQSWSANVGQTNTVSPGVLFSSAPTSEPFIESSSPFTEQQDYNMLGYLADEIFANPTGSGVAGYQFAIWVLNDYNSGAGAAWTTTTALGTPFEDTVVGDLQAAYNAVHDGTSVDLTVYTPQPTCDGQEFLTQGSVPEVPTGAMGTGIVLLMAGTGFLKRRRLLAR